MARPVARDGAVPAYHRTRRVAAQLRAQAAAILRRLARPGPDRLPEIHLFGDCDTAADANAWLRAAALSHLTVRLPRPSAADLGGVADRAVVPELW